MSHPRGPLDGLRVLEVAGLGPAPFAAMVLADLGAEVVRLDRTRPPDLPVDPRYDLLNRGKRSVAVDLRHPRAAGLVRDLVARVDVLLEGFRPGVAERLGFGPAAVHKINARLVYGRMTGWGRDGPLATTAGHDLNYLALTGVLHAIGPPDAPVPPLNLIGDFGGGGMSLVAGVLAALWRAGRTGAGQVVDASIVDGAALLATSLFGLLHSGAWRDSRQANLLDGAAPHYGVYHASDGLPLAVCPLEPKFFAQFVALLGGLGEPAPDPADPTGWPRLRTLIAARLATRTRAEWLEIFNGTDACVTPVLSLTEAAGHPYALARDAFVEVEGVRQPAPAPRFSQTPPAVPGRPPMPGEHTRLVLEEWAVADVDELIRSGVVVQT